MTKPITLFALLVSPALSNAQTTQWSIDASHAKIGFTISHFGISETEGRFSKFYGTVFSDKADFSDSKIDFTAEVSSIDTDDEQRDKHLKSPDFFDADKYPQVTFKGKSLKPIGKGKYKLTGDFTMHGVTKEITLEAAYKGTVIDPYKNTKAGFLINGTIDRTEWGLMWNGNLAAGGVLVGNEVNLSCNIELLRK